MKIVFLLLMLMSAPNQPSIKYKGVLYTTEVECEIAKAEYLNAYENKGRDYKDLIVTEAYCIPFNAFPLIKAGVEA
jgi:hypothetical protein